MTESTPTRRTIDRDGKYVMGPRLGAGGMAEVFLGWTVGEHGFSRTVVLKRILPAWSANEQFSAMFINEARLASLLHHPNIVGTYLLDRDPEGCLFQVLEYIDGRDLEKVASAGSLPIPVAVSVIASVLRGLDHAHSARNPSTGRPLGIVHRDCTPSNILIDYAGNVKVSDFGVAKAVYATNATRPGTAKGKPGYISPEQLRGIEVDGRSDLFAVGVMLWELLAGYHLFTGPTVEAVITRVLEYANGAVPIPAIESVNREVPLELALFVGNLLAVDRNQRPPTAAAALARMRPWIPADGAEQLAQLLAERFPRPTPGADGAAELARPSGETAVLPDPPGNAGNAKARIEANAGTPVAIGQVAAAATGHSPVASPSARQRWIGLGVAALTVAIVGVAVGVALSGGTRAADQPEAPPEVSPIVTIETADALTVDAAAHVATPTPAASIDAGALGEHEHDAAPPASEAGLRGRGKQRSARDAGARAEIIEVNLGDGAK